MSWTGEPEKPAVALGGHAPRSVRRLPWRSLVVGLAVGALVASGAVAVVLRPTGSASAGRLVELSVDALPATVMGRTRSDLEFRDRSPAQSDRIRSLAAAGMSSYVRSYGGSGIEMAYGIYAGREIRLVAVNGDLNLPLAQYAVVVEHYGFVGPFTPVTVAGTITTSCVYAPDDMIGLQGQTASDLIDHLIATGPAAGKLACVRRGAGRLFSVQLSGTGVSSDSPAAAAFQMASAVDQVWEELVSR
jgi:hypothetical protein